MRRWTTEALEKDGYKIENAKITNVDLSMENHGCMTLSMVLEGASWGCVYGGYCIGKGYLDADPDTFEANGSGMVYLMRIMDTVGVERFNSLKGMYVRVATKHISDSVKIIGNIIRDKWFDSEQFFTDKWFEEEVD